MSMDASASAEDMEAMQEALLTTFDAGNVVGKLMAFIAQLHSSSEVTWEYLAQICTSLGCSPLEIKLWMVLTLQKAIDCFCCLADNNDDIPSLSGKKWADYQLSVHEWDIIKLAYNCLKVLRVTHGELSANKRPTCYKVFPLLEMVQTKWKEFLEDAKYLPIYNALSTRLNNMQKWYCKADDTSIYFISHVLDPTQKLIYVEAAWEYEHVESNMQHLQKIHLNNHKA
ncbi:hypothetical protein AX15_005530 [Amanita polypyramis BW_CC]|nr:hypothetical protein AX15_005530 [Amanita polypyramis BW_CC]